MRLSILSGPSRVGNVEVHDVFPVIELDAGYFIESHRSGSTSGQLGIPFSHESFSAIGTQLAIIVPCLDEETGLLEGVLRGVPHDCLIILVSKSNPSNFESERNMVTRLNGNTQRSAIVIHQHDEILARAFHNAGMPALLFDLNPPCIRNGKGEAMMIGAAIAKLAGKRFVGFIDADNFVPGSVHEYCKVYAAGLHYALQSAKPGETEPYAMVRINWKSKPKVKDGKLVFEESGRSSRVVNEWFNRLLNELDGSRTRENFIKTGNAGEHAMSIDLALQLHFATQYAVEPSQLIDAWEQFGDSKAPSSRKLRILQIRTCNPHFHDTSKGDGHIERMQAQGLGTIYYSRLASHALKDQLRTYMKQNLPTVVDADGEPDTTRVYPPLSSLDFQVFRKVLKQKSDTDNLWGRY